MTRVSRLLATHAKSASSKRLVALLLLVSGVTIAACASRQHEDASQNADLSGSDGYSKLPYHTNLNLK